MAARRTTATLGAAVVRSVPAKRRTRAVTRHRTQVAPAPRVVEDDTGVLAAEHAARDAELLDLVSRLSV